ncbi:4032_t:CDS:2, partial [Gigaspora rosea]
MKDPIISQIENLRRHLKRNFEHYLRVGLDGKPLHDNCIDHCLLFAFGDNDKYNSQLLEMQEKLKYFFAHHARKYYLNKQYKTSMMSFDSDGAIMIADYKMRILSKTARETKQEFFAKRGWTLHMILVITKEESNSVEDDSIEDDNIEDDSVKDDCA